MLAGDLNRCIDFPCTDVRHAGNVRPDLPARRWNIRVVMISAAPPYRGGPRPLHYSDPAVRNEILAAFRHAGYDVDTIDDIHALGVYCTTAVKCPKLGYGLRTDTISNCSRLLEAEIDMFPNLKSILLMGNTAIKSINAISSRRFGSPAIPTGSAYVVKGHEYQFGDVTLFPSYPTSGREFSVEDHREVIAIDIRNAIEVAGGPTTRPRTTRHRGRPHSPVPRPHEVQGTPSLSSAVQGSPSASQ